jgi:hypothetical protein
MSRRCSCRRHGFGLSLLVCRRLLVEQKQCHGNCYT